MLQCRSCTGNCSNYLSFRPAGEIKFSEAHSTIVQNRRFEEARKLLTGTDFSVGDISSVVGMKPCRMRGVFQKHEHLSPLAFRKGHHRGE